MEPDRPDLARVLYSADIHFGFDRIYKSVVTMGFASKIKKVNH